MAILHVRDIPDDLYQELKERAGAEGRSITAETIVLLRQALMAPRRPQRDVLQEIFERPRFDTKEHRAPSAEEMIRADRDR